VVPADTLYMETTDTLRKRLKALLATRSDEHAAHVSSLAEVIATREDRKAGEVLAQLMNEIQDDER
jgi:hypothetical protein